MNSVAEREDTIVQEITIKGAAERIFAALLDPAELMEWWRATGKFEVTHMETDLRVGGKWMMRVKGNCGPTGYSTVTGVYREIDPPHALVFTWSRPEENEPESTVRWDLKEEDGGDHRSRDALRADKRRVAHPQQWLADCRRAAAGLRGTK